MTIFSIFSADDSKLYECANPIYMPFCTVSKLLTALSRTCFKSLRTSTLPTFSFNFLIRSLTRSSRFEILFAAVNAATAWKYFPIISHEGESTHLSGNEHQTQESESRGPWDSTPEAVSKT